MKYLLHDLQKFIVDVVKNDSDYNEKVRTDLGKDFTYHINPHILDEDEDLPSFAVYGLESQKEPRGSDYIVQYVITDLVEHRAEIVDGIKVYPTKKTLENLGVESLKLIENGLRLGLLGSCDLDIVHRSLVMTPIGEADDVKVVVTLRLEEKNFF
jgi:hypothetical protein